MADEKKESVVKKIRNRIILVLVVLAVGIALGYYLGYDIGFEKAARILTSN